MNALPFLARSLSKKRLLLVVILTTVAAAAIFPLFLSGTKFVVLWGRLFVVALTMLLTFEWVNQIHPRLPWKRLPLVAAQVIGVFVSSILGTVLSGLLIGRSLADMVSVEPIFTGMLVFVAVGVGVGAIASTVLVYREQAARAAAEAARAESQRHELEKQVLEARVQLMQAQIEPHFLFNTLANVQHLVEANPPLAAKTLESLITYLRAALPDMRKGGTTLGREAEMARAFLDIHKIRMGSRLEFSVEVAPELATQPFPAMMLLTLVENAIKHGVDPLQAGGEVRVRAALDDTTLEVSVADTGNGLSQWSGTGLGLQNIRERLATLFGRTGRLLLEENTPRGVVARIRVPTGTAAESAGQLPGN